MKIYTNLNNTSTLKLLIAANLANKQVELKTTSFEAAIFAGPRSLPLLEVDEQLVFFSSNAAAQYLFPVLDLSANGQCQQMQEWEATRLHPAVQTVLTSKSVASDLKQLMTSLVADIDNLLAKNKYILGVKLSAADISIFSTLYPIYYNADLKPQYLNEAKHIAKWMEELAASEAIQEAIKQWGGSAKGPFGAPSALGLPQVASLQLTPLGSPDESNTVEAGPTPEELETAKENWLNGLQTLPEPVKHEKVVLPVKGRKNILITSALPYVNNVPHLGNIIGCVLSADIFAR